MALRTPRTGFRAALASLLALAALSAVVHQRLSHRPVERAPAASEGPAGVSRPRTESERELTQFDRAVFEDLSRTFERELGERGQALATAKLVHFEGRVRSPCGRPDDVAGTFYCEREGRVYADLELYRRLRSRFGSDGDFAQAYALAHAMGHHLQSVRGTSAWLARKIARSPSREAELRARYELQADCYAAVWARLASERELVRRGDLEAATVAAARAGEELGARAGSATVLETYAHATAERRAAWFERGFENGRVEACDVFAHDAL